MLLNKAELCCSNVQMLLNKAEFPSDDKLGCKAPRESKR